MSRNEQLFQEAQQWIPGGVNSPVRAFGPVGGTPPFITHASGCTVTDADGREYIDYVGSWGPMILGHGHPEVVAAVRDAVARGTSFGAPTEGEIRLAERICERVPNAEMVRLVSSGTEAAMTAVRLSRGITGRDKIIKFIGCYHGHADGFLVAAGSGAATHGQPSSPGVPDAIAGLTLLAPYNDLDAVASHFTREGDDIACVIVEPVAGNMGCVPPAAGFLEGLRELTARHGAQLVFDEVMTGFRVHPRCAQGLFGVTPDLTTLGKIVGGGLPVGAIAGPRALLEQLSPAGPIYQAGTLSGNPLSVAAGLATLDVLARDEELIYPRIAEQTAHLLDGFAQAFTERGIPHQLPRAGSMFCIYFSAEPVTDFASAQAADADLFRRYFHAMLAQGIAFAPSPFEAGFVSNAHDHHAVERTVAALRRAEF